MRLWGKITGTKADYYVVEATMPEGDAEEGGEEAGEDAEARGATDSANKYVYFVTNSPIKPWVQLPDIKPSQINNARRTKHLFTGYFN